MTVKESFDVAGLPTTWGVLGFKDTKAETNALAVDRLLAAGAVVFGKSNVPLRLADWQSYHSIYRQMMPHAHRGRSPGWSKRGRLGRRGSGKAAATRTPPTDAWPRMWQRLSRVR
jgi:amidase